MPVLVGFRGSNGVLVAGTGRTTSEALSQFSSVIGSNGALNLFNDAVDEARELSDESMRTDGGGDAAPHSESGGGDPHAGSGSGARGGPTADTSSSAGPSTGGSSEASRTLDESDGEGAGGAAGTAEASEGEETYKDVCAVCGVGLTADRAEVSHEEYGEPRCKQHSG